MDPNASKKNLLNKLSKEEALKRLYAEDFKRVTVSFYNYVIIEDPSALRDVLFQEWKKLQVFGRIYVAQEGINAQLSVPEYLWEKFVVKVHGRKEFKNIPFKIAVEDDGKSFFKLTIKVREQIVADGLTIDEYDVTNVGKHLSAEEWNKAMEEGAVIVDMRNHYESEIGHFEGAICPQSETFKEELPEVKEMLEGKEGKKVLLYCTGGIRCEKTSAYLKHHGFEDVNQLHGGIIDYARQLKKNPNIKNNFEGRNFVFDERRGERISDKIISNCHQCGDPFDQHVNCKNTNCNLLFIQCDKCKKKYENCCSIECIEVINMPLEKQKQLRKGIENKKMYYSQRKIKLNLSKK